MIPPFFTIAENINGINDNMEILKFYYSSFEPATYFWHQRAKTIKLFDFSLNAIFGVSFLRWVDIIIKASFQSIKAVGWRTFQYISLQSFEDIFPGTQRALLIIQTERGTDGLALSALQSYTSNDNTVSEVLEQHKIPIFFMLIFYCNKNLLYIYIFISIYVIWNHIIY